ncbi:MAG: GxxExxY protein [Planctomycetota bacterium]
MGDRRQNAERDPLTDRIIACAIEVHRELGPGLPERAYETAFEHELSLAALDVERQVPISLEYKGATLPSLRLDLVVERTVVVELKAVERVADVHLAQLVSYLRAGRYPTGLLLNFNVPVMKNGIYRRANTGPKNVTHRSAPLRPSAPLRSLLLGGVSLVALAGCYERVVSSKGGIYGATPEVQQGNLRTGDDQRPLDRFGNVIFGEPSTGKRPPREE